MQIALEPADIQAVAELVIRALTPMLTEIRDNSRRAALPQARPVEPAPGTPQRRPEMLTRTELAGMTGLSSSTLWRLERDGRFPARLPLSQKRVGWRRTEVEAWLAERRSA